MSSISAGLSDGTALVSTGDTTGELVLKTNGGTTAVTIGTDQRVTLAAGLTTSSPTVFPAGTAGAPSITFTGDTNTGIFSPAADTIAFSEGGAEAMRIDSSGNVGIGVTPSAWGTGLGLVALDIGGAGTVLGTGATVVSGANCYFDGSNWKYKTSTWANRYEQNNGNTGVHAWFTAPSGTAGNNITFTERMRIDSDGYLRMASGSGGIQFNGDTAAANALDDYEEGTWTPVFTSETTGAQTVTYTGQLGVYTKIGRIVFCRFAISWSAWTRTGSVILINNLPFNPSAANVLSGVVNGATNISFTNRSGGVGTQINIEAYAGNIFSISSTASGMNVADARLDPSAFGATGAISGLVVYTT